LPSYAFNRSGSPPGDHRSRLGGPCNILIILLTLCECFPERLPCLVEYIKVTQQFPRPYARFTSYLYKVYETIPPLVTSWYPIWAKVIVIVATYRRVVTQPLLPNRAWSKYSPPLKTPNSRNAGNSATSLPAVPAHCQFVPSAPSFTPKQSFAALTLPALRVAIPDLFSPAVHPRWHAALTAKKWTLRTARIAPPAQRPLQKHQRYDLDRRRTAWISLKTRLALRRSFVQHQVPLFPPRVPLYSPAMLLHLDRGPNLPSPSPISPQERVVMNPSTLTPPRALPINAEFVHSIHRQ